MKLELSTERFKEDKCAQQFLVFAVFLFRGFRKLNSADNNLWEENVFKYWISQMCNLESLLEVTEFLLLRNSSCFCQHQWTWTPTWDYIGPECLSRKWSFKTLFCLAIIFVKTNFEGCNHLGQTHVGFIPVKWRVFEAQDLTETNFLGISHQELRINIDI